MSKAPLREPPQAEPMDLDQGGNGGGLEEEKAGKLVSGVGWDQRKVV